MKINDWFDLVTVSINLWGLLLSIMIRLAGIGTANGLILILLCWLMGMVLVVGGDSMVSRCLVLLMAMIVGRAL